ncbi:MAG TPA: hypothetical protein VN241_12695 [Microbacterium sp.]|nr:hypothetical protein [Microbacterium sp.]
MLAAAVIMLGLAPVAAHAAGTLDLDVTILDQNGQLVSVVDARSMASYTVNVAYSCNTENCLNTSIVVASPPTDPTYQLYRKEIGEPAYVPPFNGAPQPTGTLATGHTLNLGTVAAGSGGVFQLQYNVQSPQPTRNGGSYFINGSPIQPQVTMSASNAAPVTESASATWYNQVPAGPSFAIGAPATAIAGTPVTVTLDGQSGCVQFTGGLFVGIPYVTCAQSWEAVVQLPADADYVTGSGGTYNAVSHTVTLSRSGADAHQGIIGGPKTFQVTFPTDSIPTSGAGCVEPQTFTGVSHTATYLDGTTRSSVGANPTDTVNVGNCEPFADASGYKDIGAADSNNSTGRVVYIPSTGVKGNSFWAVRAANEANVPATVTIVDDDLDNTAIPVDRISGGGFGFPVTVEYTLEDGTNGTGTLANNASVITAPAGHRFTSVQAQTSQLPRSINNTEAENNTATVFELRMYFSLAAGTAPGSHTNNATMTVEFPGTTFAPEQITSAQTVSWMSAPVAVTLNPNALTVDTGGSVPLVESQVSWTMSGTMTGLPAANTIRPQYVYLAPAGWNVVSASFPAGGSGITLGAPTTVTYGGATYSAIVAEWDAPTGITGTASLPAMRVVTTPTIAASPGSNNQTGRFFLGDAANGIFTGYVGGRIDDTTDIDGDDSVDDAFALRSLNTSLAGSSGINVVKEICQPDDSEADGCRWLYTPEEAVGVAPNTTDILYRVTIVNSGNTALSGVVGYDVLPYPGDTGTGEASASIPRGSTFAETLAGIESNQGLTLQFSNSTNPARTEVNAPAGGVNDWDTTPAGAQAIKMSVASLAGNSSISFTYRAAVAGDPPAGGLACNSVAVKALTTSVVEPPSVCAMVQSADLSAGDDAELPAQVGRPVAVPFTFANVGTETAATVTVEVPEGATVTEFPAGWDCTAPPTAPVTGPADMVCTLTALPDGDDVQMSLRVIPVVAGELEITATVDGPVFDPDEDNNAQTFLLEAAAAPEAELLVGKTDGVDAAVPGQELTYSISVTNPLTTEDLTDVAVTDTLPAGFDFVSATAGGAHDAGSVRWTIPGIAAGTQATLQVTVRVSDAAAGTSTNTVTAEAADPGFPGEALTGGATDTDAVDRITFTKIGTVSSTGSPRADDEVTYTFTVTNTGGGTLTGVTVADPMTGLSDLTYDWPAAEGVLAPGAVVTATATYALTQADVDAGSIANTATATASSAGGGALSTDATETIPLSSASSLTFDKSVSETTSTAGEPLTYTFEIENTGNTTLSGVAVSDPMAGLSALAYTWPGAPGVLTPGQTATATATYAVTLADIESGTLRNTASVTASPPTGPALTDDDTVTVTFTQNPSLQLEKSGSVPDPENVVVGTEVDYAFVVMNTGNVTVSGITISDAMAGLSAITYGAWPGSTGVLAPGQSVTATATYSVTQADIDRGGVTNTATAAGTAPGGNPSSTDTVTVPLQLDPSIALTKTGELDQAGTPEAGDTLTFRFEAENTGNATLTGVAIDDDLESLSDITYDWPGAAGTLSGGETVTATATYELTQADIDRGFVLNTATVSGAAPDDDEISASDSAQVNLAAAPSIAFAKTTDFDGSGDPRTGDQVTYSFSVENTGNVTLNGIAISDALEGVSDVAFDAWPGTVGMLAPGQSVTATASYSLTQADLDTGSVTNDASVQASAARGGVVSGADEVSIALAASPSVALDKTASRQGGEVPRAGDVITYTFTVANVGNMTLSSVDIVDGMPGLSDVAFGAWPGAVGVLAPEQSVTATATYVLRQIDLDAGEIVNDALVTAAPARGATAVDDASVITELQAAPAATFDKAGELAEAERPMAGDILTFTFAIANTGNVTLDEIGIQDDLDGLSDIAYGLWPADEGSLAPGQSVTATATYTLTQADVDAGERGNEATASFSPTRGEAFIVDADTVVEIAQLPSLALVKTADLTEATVDGVAQPGDRIDFGFEVTNTGNVTISNVTVEDPMVAVPAGVATLAPGEAATVTANPYTVSSTDGDNGLIVNTATAAGDAPNGQRVLSDEASVAVSAAPLSREAADLASTGGIIASTAGGLAALLLLAGAAAVVSARRRRPHPSSVVGHES